ncbi:DUF1524 domain-containing protein [Streptomyces sp. NPDC127117]|uniref:GmrSD restriction endonuclease domain-containing protein n=1 Tax=Streptomyces sp. NPDC127117 TaxID=3345368 RepID=UPI0036287745
MQITREVTLQRDGQNVVQDDQCRAVSGTWYSEYDGLTIDSVSRIDIDHVVPLKEAWRSGASEWTTPERRAFANDLVHSQLIAVSAGSNRAKGDKDPGNGGCRSSRTGDVSAGRGLCHSTAEQRMPLG